MEKEFIFVLMREATYKNFEVNFTDVKCKRLSIKVSK